VPLVAVLSSAGRLGHATRFPQKSLPFSFQQRTFAERRPIEDGKALIVSQHTPIGKLAGALAYALRRSDTATMESVNKQAAFVVVKALASASEFLAEEAENKDSKLGATFWERRKLQEDGESHRTVLHTKASRVVVPPPSPDAKLGHVKIAAQTNAGKAGASIAWIIRDKEGPGLAAYGTVMGGAAVHQALVSCAIAQHYLNQDEKGARFVVVPEFMEMLVEGHDRTTRQLRLNFVKL